METYFAKIEDGKVVHVEVVTPEFVSENPERYSGTWIQVGNGVHPMVGKGYNYLEHENKFISPQPFSSWTLNENYQWEAPIPKPGINFYWNENELNWVEIT